jgi:uncharacterized protein (TIGR04255 family)
MSTMMPTKPPVSHPNQVAEPQSMGEYLPFAGRNAIAEMSMAIQFALPFDQQIGTAEEAIKAEFLAEFPKFEPVQMFTLNIGVQQFATGGGNPAPTLNGFNLTKTKSDATPARVLRAIANVVSMHFFEYISWKETRPQGIGYITRCLKKLAIMERNPATSVLLRYVDRFTFDGAAEDATAGKLFRPDNKFVPSNLLDRGYQWHCNSGWFEPLVGDAPAFNQLTITSNMIKTAVGVSLDHNSIYNLPKQFNSLVELTHGTNEHPALGEIFDRQHNVNANLLRNLLNQKMLDTIGLKR